MNRGFAGPLSAWYRKNGRKLPWRDGADGYRVAVSEFMLQQTQVERVVPIFRRFLRSFPSWRRLAAADSADVTRAWKGLGYNLRAVRLKRLAEEVVARHGGKLPRDLPSLLALKGIGPYTARALLVFVHRQDLLAPDTNVRRVLSRLFLGPTADPAAVDGKTWGAWEKGLRKGEGYDVNQALMDLGASVCKARKPLCHACPLSARCASFPRILHLEPERLPRMKKAARERLDEHGIPNRIYRGRIIDRLRAGSVREGDLAGLGRVVREGFKRTDLKWLRGVLVGLEKDGLVRRERGRISLA
jgi:A/G-specific adenine glycosylase